MSLSSEDAAKLGGSDLAGLMGLSPWATPLTIYIRVVNAMEGRDVADADDAPKRRGRHLEGAVLRLYAEETGAKVEESVKLTHPRLPFGRASLDGVALRDSLFRVVEVKTAGMSEVRQWGEAGTDAIPQGYIFQTCYYAGVAKACGQTDVDDVDVAALVGGDLRVYVVPFDPELFSMLEAAMERFWKDHVLPRRPPPVTDPLRDVDAIGALYPRHSGGERHFETFASEEQRAILDHIKAKARLKRAEMRAAGTEAVLKMALKETPKVYGLPASTGVKSITWKKNRAGMETDWRAVAAELSDLNDSVVRSIIEKHTTTTEGARPLRIWATKEEE